MKKEYKIDKTIRGDFYRIELTKRYKGIPGFAPEYHNKHIGTITVKFRKDKPYFQSADSLDVLEIEDIKEILQLIKKGYRKKDFN